VKQYLGADPDVNWLGCVESVYSDYFEDISQSYAPNVTYILSQSVYPIKVMIYNGQDDIIVNTPGVETYIRGLKWTGLPFFLASKKYIWSDPSGYVVGNFQQYKNFTFVNVYKAGHGVPTDQPWSAWDMVQNFIEDTWDKSNPAM
jgi:carboxypeptidase C (cathepsin A)